MTFGVSAYELAMYFVVYSFLGWVLEVVYHAVTLGKVINRGFLNGPVCPVYGFGVVSVFCMINTIEGCGVQMNDVMIFLFGVVLATSVELIAGWALYKHFHARWWDYSNKPMNLNGFICAEFSLLWGMAILLVVRVIQAYVQRACVDFIPQRVGELVLAVLYVCYLSDWIVTVAIIQGFNKKLTRLDEIREEMRFVSDRMSEYLGFNTIKVAQKADEGRVQAALATAELRDTMNKKKEAYKGTGLELKSLEELKEHKEQLQRKYESLCHSMTKNKLFGVGHLLRAFPGMTHNKYDELVKMIKEKL